MKAKLVKWLNNHKWEVIVVLLGVLVLGVVFSYLFTFGTARSRDQAVWGQFGDYFGGILNPVLSFCAFVGLLFTLRFQHAEALKSEKRQSDQQFDARLFQMLGLLNTSLASVHLHDPEDESKSVHTGQAAFKIAKSNFVDALRNIDANIGDEEVYEKSKKVMKRWSKDCGNSMLSYFDTLLFFSLYVRDNSTGESQKFAARAVRSQLSQEARVLLFYLLVLSGNKKLYSFWDKHGYWGSDFSEETSPHANCLLRVFKTQASGTKVITE